MKINKRIYILDALRGFAAINVVLMHIFKQHTIHPLFMMTNTYVTAFFVISGFSNFISYRSTDKFFKDTILYYLNRILRVSGFMLFFYISYFLILQLFGLKYPIKILYTNLFWTFWEIIKYPFLAVTAIFGSTSLSTNPVLKILSYKGIEYNPNLVWGSQLWSIVQEYMFYFLTPFIMLILNKYKKIKFLHLLLIFLGLLIIVEILTQMNIKQACKHKLFEREFWQESCDALAENKSFYFNEVDVFATHIRLNSVYRFRSLFNIINYNLLAYVGGMFGSYIYVNIWQHKLADIYEKYKVNMIFYISLLFVWFINFCVYGPWSFENYIKLLTGKHSNLYLTVYTIIYILSYVFIFSLWKSNGNKYFSKTTTFLGLLSFPIYIIHFVFLDELVTKDMLFWIEQLFNHSIDYSKILFIYVLIISIIYIRFDIKVVKYKNKILKYVYNLSIWNYGLRSNNDDENNNENKVQETSKDKPSNTSENNLDIKKENNKS